LVEADLAEAYGVSKTPVREALLSLTRVGLVEIDSFRGARVRGFTTEDVREIYEMRALLEPFALGNAASIRHPTFPPIRCVQRPLRCLVSGDC
jgi:DNA-binding GntR family transcriptional regulator